MQEDLIKIVSSSSAFVVARTHKSIVSSSEIVEVAQYDVNGVAYSIIKQVMRNHFC